jgi:DNA-directed RNA polymerase subunit beta'
MKKMGIKPHELMLSRVPVIPPAFRPFNVTGDTFVAGDANELYRDLINLVGVHHEITQKLGPGSNFNHLNIYDAMSALYGFGDPTSPKTKERGVSGFLKKVTGTNPKLSFFQHQMLAKDMDYVGRSVIGVDPDLGLDEIGVPDEVLWKLYSPYLQRNLVRSGMSAEEALRAIKDQSDPAKRALDLEIKSRPVVYSRAPSWHKFNVIAGYPKKTEGNMIRINPLVTTGLNADFDGDTMNIHLPSMPESVRDAREKLMPSKMLFSVKDRNKVMPVPKQEMLLGLWQAQNRKAANAYTFPNEAAALAAIKRGEVRLSDDITILNQPKQ